MSSGHATADHKHPSSARRPEARTPIRRMPALAMIFLASSLAASGTSAGNDPKVPPGRDPGGVPVAMIGPGTDYRSPEIHQRLARDGEGDPIGWDFVDNDLTPYAPDDACPPQGCAATAQRRPADPVRLLLSEAGASKLILLRTKDGDRGALAAAIAFAARSPARIVPTLARGGDPAGAGAAAISAGPDWRLMIEAARRFSNLLFIVPATGPPIDVPGFDALPIGNLLIVAATTTARDATEAGAGTMRPAADLAVGVDVPDGVAVPAAGERTEQAVARVAALAARLLAVEPILDAHGMKQRILSLAQPLPERDKALARSGWLPEPHRHFRLE